MSRYQTEVLNLILFSYIFVKNSPSLTKSFLKQALHINILWSTDSALCAVSYRLDISCVVSLACCLWIHKF